MTGYSFLDGTTLAGQGKYLSFSLAVRPGAPSLPSFLDVHPAGAGSRALVHPARYDASGDPITQCFGIASNRRFRLHPAG